MALQPMSCTLTSDGRTRRRRRSRPAIRSHGTSRTTGRNPGPSGQSCEKGTGTDRFILTNQHVLHDTSNLFDGAYDVYDPHIKTCAGIHCNHPIAQISNPNGGVQTLRTESDGRSYFVDCALARVNANVHGANRASGIGALNPDLHGGALAEGPARLRPGGARARRDPDRLHRHRRLGHRLLRRRRVGVDRGGHRLHAPPGHQRPRHAAQRRLHRRSSAARRASATGSRSLGPRTDSTVGKRGAEAKRAGWPTRRSSNAFSVQRVERQNASFEGQMS